MVTTETYRKLDKWAEYLVRNNEKIVGMLIKHKNTKTETFPWQAYKAGVYIGSFFGKKGKEEAIEAITKT